MTRISSVLASLLVLGAMACGSEAGLPDDTVSEADDVKGNGAAGPDSTEPSGAEGSVDLTDLDELDRANLAPGYQHVEYPTAPYGVTAGAVASDMEFLGWWSPADDGYDISKAQPVRISDFYDPTGSKGTELLLISAVAVWCGVCRTEFAEIESKAVHSTLGARGLQILGILFEDNDAEPARYVDLVNWAKAYGVQFPMVMDPGFKSGIYFDRSATPMNMLIDARTMQILLVMTGYNSEIYDYIDRVLTQRGR